MLRQQTESFKSRLESVPGWSGTPPRTLVWAIAGVLILGGLLYVINGARQPAMEPLLGGRAFREVELNRAELAFGDAGLSGWQRDGQRLLVPKQQRHDYLAVLKQSSAVPFGFQVTPQSSFDAGGLFESDAQRRLRRQTAKARDLGQKLASFEDIAWASVDYDEQVTRGFDPQTLQSASVIVTPQRGEPLAADRIRMIQNLVRAAYAGMQADQVTVTDTAACKAFCGDGDPHTRRRRQAESELEQRLAELLRGYGGLRIAVASGASASLAGEAAEGADSASTAGVADSAETAASDGRAPSPATVPADWAMRISIGVPESQFHVQWAHDFRTENPGGQHVLPPSREQWNAVREKVFQNIRDAVAPFVDAQQHDHAIRLWSFLDDPPTDLYLASSNGGGTWPRLHRLLHTRPWSLLPLVVLGLIGLGLGLAALRLRLQSTQRAEPVTTAQAESHGDSPVGDPGGEPGDGGGVSAAAVTRDGGFAAGASLKEDLAELVDSNPELAAQIVHSWIHEAA